MFKVKINYVSVAKSFTKFRTIFTFSGIAFLVALHQNKQLLGSSGLLPTDHYLGRIKQHFKDTPLYQVFGSVPTLLLFIDEVHIDWWLDCISYVGLGISLFIFVTGAANMIMMVVLWLLYHSLVNIGQRW